MRRFFFMRSKRLTRYSDNDTDAEQRVLEFNSEFIRDKNYNFRLTETFLKCFCSKPEWLFSPECSDFFEAKLDNDSKRTIYSFLVNQGGIIVTRKVDRMWDFVVINVADQVKILEFAHQAGCTALRDAALANMAHLLVFHGVIPTAKLMQQSFAILSPENVFPRKLLLECCYTHLIEKRLPMEVFYDIKFTTEDEAGKTLLFDQLPWVYHLHNIARWRTDSPEVQPTLETKMLDILSELLPRQKQREVFASYLELAIELTQNEFEVAQPVEPRAESNSLPKRTFDDFQEDALDRSTGAHQEAPGATEVSRTTGVSEGEAELERQVPTSTKKSKTKEHRLAAPDYVELYMYYRRITFERLAIPVVPKFVTKTSSNVQCLKVTTRNKKGDLTSGTMLPTAFLMEHSHSIKKVLESNSKLRTIVLEDLDDGSLRALYLRLTGQSNGKNMLQLVRATIAAERLEMPDVVLSCMDELELNFSKLLKEGLEETDQYLCTVPDDSYIQGWLNDMKKDDAFHYTDPIDAEADEEAQEEEEDQSGSGSIDIALSTGDKEERGRKDGAQKRRSSKVDGDLTKTSPYKKIKT